MPNSLTNMLKALLPVGVYKLNNGTNVYKELQSYCAALDVFKETVDSVLSEISPVCAIGDGLVFYEKLFGDEKYSYSIEQRRRMILTMLLLGANDNTVEGIKRFFASLGVECELEEYFNTCFLYVYVLNSESFDSEERKNIIERAKEFLPCHLEFSVDFRTIDWDTLDSYDRTFAQIDALDMTWGEFEAYNGEQEE